MSTCLAIPKSQPLGAALELLSRFDRTGIRYCDFKSNEHPTAGLSGHTDVDMRATQLRPDLVIKLDLPPEIAARPKPETTVEELGRRRSTTASAAGMWRLMLRLAVKRAVWEKL